LVAAQFSTESTQLAQQPQIPVAESELSADQQAHGGQNSSSGGLVAAQYPDAQAQFSFLKESSVKRKEIFLEMNPDSRAYNATSILGKRPFQITKNSQQATRTNSNALKTLRPSQHEQRNKREAKAGLKAQVQSTYTDQAYQHFALVVSAFMEWNVLDTKWEPKVQIDQMSRQHQKYRRWPDFNPSGNLKNWSLEDHMMFICIFESTSTLQNSELRKDLKTLEVPGVNEAKKPTVNEPRIWIAQINKPNEKKTAFHFSSSKFKDTVQESAKWFRLRMESLGLCNVKNHKRSDMMERPVIEPPITRPVMF
jgi:hypothetical protein